MINPYESPRVNAAGGERNRPRPHAWRSIGYGFTGALAGYLVLVVLGNLEDRPFYTIRSLVTGETSPMRIFAHPADWWTHFVLTVGFLFGGTIAGFWLARRHSN